MRHIFCFWALLCLSLSVSAQEMMESPQPVGPFFVQVPVDPMGTFLRTSSGDNSNPASSFTLDLSQYGINKTIQPGDQLFIQAVGDFSSGGADDISSMVGVFSGSSGFVEPMFVSGFGVPEIQTLSSSQDSVPTDIPEDFPILFQRPIPIFVPAGADKILFSANDSFFADNVDPDGDFSVAFAIDLVVDLIMDKVVIVQTVKDPDIITEILNVTDPNAQNDGIFGDGRIDLVQDKSAIAIAEGFAPGYESGFFGVNFRIERPGTTFDSIVIPAIAKIGTDRTFKAAIKLPTDLPGDFQIIASIRQDPNILENDKNNNVSPYKYYRVTQTNQLDIGMVQVTGCSILIADCPGAVSFEQTQEFLSTDLLEFLTKVYPVADSGQLTTSLIENNYSSVIDFDPALDNGEGDLYDYGLYEDIIMLAKLKTMNLKRKVFAIVPDNYICFHNINCRSGSKIEDQETLGITFPDVNLQVGIVRGSSPSTIAHEMAHLLGQGLEAYQLNDEVVFDPSSPSDANYYFIDGYDVSIFTPPTPEDPTSSNLDSVKLLNRRPVIGAFDSSNYSDYWVTRNTYQKAFKALLSPAVDPEIYIVSGLLDRSGNLTNVRVEESPVGNLSFSDPAGSFSVKTFDVNGVMVNEISTNPDFRMIVTRRSGQNSSKTIELEKIPVVIAIPKVAEVATIKVFNGPEELFEEVIIEPKVKVSDLLKSVPLSAFKGKGWYRWYNRFKKRLLVDIAKKAERLEAKEKNIAAIWTYRKLKKLVNRWVKSKFVVDGELVKRKTLIREIKNKIKSLK